MSSTTTRPKSERSTRRVTARNQGEGRLAFWLVIPSIIILTVVIGYPVVQSLIRSLWGDAIGNPSFVGFGNYQRALWGLGAKEFWDATGFTYFIAAITLILEALLGLAMALLMNRAFRGRGLLRASVLVPWAVPTAVAAVLWKWAFDPSGIVNAIMGQEIVWTGSRVPSTIAIIIADTWKTAPFIALLILAGLQVIPDEVYEAAKIDGASAWQRFCYITLPLVKPALLVALLFRLLDALRMYDLPAIMTNGANNTTTLSILVVRSTLSQLKPGYGGALATLTFLFIFVTAYLFVRVLGVNAVDSGEKAEKGAKK